MGLTDISWPGLFIGVPAPNLFYWGSRPKPRRCAKLSRMSTLLSLRGRLMAGEVPRSKRGKVTGRGGPLMRTSSGKVAGKAFPVR